MKIKLTKNKVLNLNTLAKNTGMIVLGWLVIYGFYKGWCYEQTVTNGNPWMGG